MVSKAVHDLDSHDIGIHFTVFCLLLMTPWSSTVQIQFSVKWKKSPHRLLPTYYQLDFRSQGKKDPWLLFAMFLHLVITTSSVCASTLEVVSLGFFSLLTIHAKLRKTSARRKDEKFVKILFSNEFVIFIEKVSIQNLFGQLRSLLEFFWGAYWLLLARFICLYEQNYLWFGCFLLHSTTI